MFALTQRRALEAVLPMPAKERRIGCVVRIVRKFCSPIRKQNLPDTINVIDVIGEQKRRHKRPDGRSSI